jgi:hypothetical protein
LSDDGAAFSHVLVRLCEILFEELDSTKSAVGRWTGSAGCSSSPKK